MGGLHRSLGARTKRSIFLFRQISSKKKNSKIIQTMMEYRHGVPSLCVCSTRHRHSTPNGVGQT